MGMAAALSPYVPSYTHRGCAPGAVGPILDRSPGERIKCPPTYCKPRHVFPCTRESDHLVAHSSPYLSLLFCRFLLSIDRPSKANTSSEANTNVATPPHLFYHYLFYYNLIYFTNFTLQPSLRPSFSFRILGSSPTKACQL